MGEEVSYNLNLAYSKENGNISFTFELGLQRVNIIMEADAFFKLCEHITSIGEPFLEKVKKIRAEIPDKNIGFDTAVWDKRMDAVEE